MSSYASSAISPALVSDVAKLFHVQEILCSQRTPAKTGTAPLFSSVSSSSRGSGSVLQRSDGQYANSFFTGGDSFVSAVPPSLRGLSTGVGSGVAAVVEKEREIYQRNCSTRKPVLCPRCCIRAADATVRFCSQCLSCSEPGGAPLSPDKQHIASAPSSPSSRASRRAVCDPSPSPPPRRLSRSASPTHPHFSDDHHSHFPFPPHNNHLSTTTPPCCWDSTASVQEIADLYKTAAGAGNDQDLMLYSTDDLEEAQEGVETAAQTSELGGGGGRHAAQEGGASNGSVWDGHMCHVKGCSWPYQKRHLLLCVKCRRGFHAKCCDPPLRYSMITRFAWCCNECKSCEKCWSNKDEGSMLICDACDRAFHMQCISPPLNTVPEGDWFCESCGTCSCCKRDLSDKEAQSKFCFISNRYRICLRCKNKYVISRHSRLIHAHNHPNSPQETGSSNGQPPKKAATLTDTRKAIADIGLVQPLCSVCIQPMYSPLNGSIDSLEKQEWVGGEGRSKRRRISDDSRPAQCAEAKVICDACEEAVHRRCCADAKDSDRAANIGSGRIDAANSPLMNEDTNESGAKKKYRCFVCAEIMEGFGVG
eukprot:GHVS01099780.1.p1 GENE.GHVS01099780.1~~GHVS01099780.1.p1  ORF type:complete len:618 (+),score=72.47 GHVS01099780.1:83-1855(+)